MIAAYLILTLIAVVLQVVSYREHDEMNSIGVIANVLAAIVATIAFIISGSNDSVSGGYIYYVNGIKIESGFMTVGATIVLAIISFGTSFGASMGLGYLIGHKRDAEEKAKPKVWILFYPFWLSRLAAAFSGAFHCCPTYRLPAVCLFLGWSYHMGTRHFGNRQLYYQEKKSQQIR